MNDANDTIQFQTNGSARLYHNSYPILTTQNTYVSNNKGYINGTEITQVNNARGAYIATLTLYVDTLIKSGYLASDYTNRYDTQEYMKAAAKYLQKNYSNQSVFGTMVPNAQGFFTANIYSDGFNSNGNVVSYDYGFVADSGKVLTSDLTDFFYEEEETIKEYLYRLAQIATEEEEVFKNLETELLIAYQDRLIKQVK